MTTSALLTHGTNIGESQKPSVKRKEPDTKGRMRCDPIHGNVRKRQIRRDRKQASGGLGAEVGGEIDKGFVRGWKWPHTDRYDGCPTL